MNALALILLVNQWFVVQHNRWKSIEEHCCDIALLFTDETWLPLTLTVAAELKQSRGTCVAIWFWTSATNTTAVAACENPAVPCFIDERHGAAAVWGTARYFNKIADRLSIVLAVKSWLNVRTECGVMLIDSDVALLRHNIFARETRSGAATFVTQQEWPCATAPYRLCVNGGVWWLRRTKAGSDFLSRAVSLMTRLAIPDQDALDLALTAEAPGFVSYLERHRAANGYVAMRDATWSLERAHLVHANIQLASLGQKCAVLTNVRAWRDKNLPSFFSSVAYNESGFVRY